MNTHLLRQKMFSVSFHTSFVTGNRLKLPKRDIDLANSDADNMHFAASFRVDLFFGTQDWTTGTRGSILATETNCGKCGDVIFVEDHVVIIQSKKFHWDCLKCTVCGFSFTKKAVVLI